MSRFIRQSLRRALTLENEATLSLAEELRHHSAAFDVSTITARMLDSAADELERLHGLLNTPHTADFMQAVALEAAHQRERWGTQHDAGKEDSDWFWLLGYLGGKALNSAKAYEASDCSDAKAHEKSLHHIITTAAACLNWHAARSFASNVMRPGIDPPSLED